MKKGTTGKWITTYKYEVGINHSMNPFSDNVQTIAFCDPEYTFAGDSRTLNERELESEANAAFICKAVNLHTELIEALKSAMLALEPLAKNTPIGWDKAHCKEIFKTVKTVLTKTD